MTTPQYECMRCGVQVEDMEVHECEPRCEMCGFPRDEPAPRLGCPEHAGGTYELSRPTVLTTECAFVYDNNLGKRRCTIPREDHGPLNHAFVPPPLETGEARELRGYEKARMNAIAEPLERGTRGRKWRVTWADGETREYAVPDAIDAAIRAPLEMQVDSDRYTINLLKSEQRQFHTMIGRRDEALREIIQLAGWQRDGWVLALRKLAARALASDSGGEG